MITSSQAGALQEILTDLAVLTVEQLFGLWRRYADSPEILAVLEAAVPEIVGQHATAAALVSAQWYDELADTDFTATPVVDLPEERLNSTIRWALYAPGDADPIERLAGSSKRMVFDASRTTIIENANTEGVSWSRYASATACEFCRLLSTRGAVYKSRQTALKSHDHCRCIAVPERGGYDPPAYVQDWEDEYIAARKAVSAAGQPQSLKNILAAMRQK